MFASHKKWGALEIQVNLDFIFQNTYLFLFVLKRLISSLEVIYAITLCPSWQSSSTT